MSAVPFFRMIAVVAGIGFATAALAQEVDSGAPTMDRPERTVRSTNQSMNNDMQIRQQNQQMQFQMNRQQQQIQQLQNRNLPSMPRPCTTGVC
jgi:hypothetical protein